MNRMAVVALAVLLVLGASSLFGQTSADSSGTQEPARWALQFAVADEQIFSYLGSVVSIKKMVTETSGWRLGLSLSLDPGTKASESEIRDYTNGNDTTIVVSRAESSSRYSISARWQILRQIGNIGKSFGYAGLGPIVTYAHRTSESTIETSGRSRTEEELNDLSVGAVMTIGAEWRPHRSFGLLGEYGLQVVYGWMEQENVRSDNLAGSSYSRVVTRLQESKGINVDATSVRLGLSVYF